MTDSEIEAGYKREARKIYEDGKTASERARGLFYLIKCYYFGHSSPPDFPTYASHWLWAQQGFFDEQAMRILIRRYPLPRRPRIQCGYTQWNSSGNPCFPLPQARGTIKVQ